MSQRRTAVTCLLTSAICLASVSVRANDIVYVPVARAPSKGPPDALVTIVAFLDFQCPFCARTMPKLLALQARHPRTVRLVFKHFPLPFHRYAELAAQAAVEAHLQGKFWAFQAQVWRLARILTPARLRAAARRAGLNLARYDAALKSSRHIPSVRADRAEGQVAGVTGTPTIFINGRRIRGAKSAARYAALVAQAEVQARRLIKQPGVTRRNLYATIMEKAFHPLIDINRPTAQGRPLPGIPPGRPTLGGRDAQVEVWLFGNPMCYDTWSFLKTWQRLQSRWGARIRVRFFHRSSSPMRIYQQAAILAEQANREGLFWAFLAAVSRERPYKTDKLLELARAVGLRDPQKALRSPSLRKTMIRDLRFAARMVPPWVGRHRSCSMVWLPPGLIIPIWRSSTLHEAIKRRVDIADQTGFILPEP